MCVVWIFGEYEYNIKPQFWGFVFGRIGFLGLFMQSIFITTTNSVAWFVAQIANRYPAWQVCFLHDECRPVIGILPKVSWQVSYMAGKFWVKKSERDGDVSHYVSDYQAWQQELENYCQQFAPSAPFDNQFARQIGGQFNPSNDGYHHGLMGFIGYDWSAYALNPIIAIKDGQPCAVMGHYDIYLKPSHQGFVLCGVGIKTGLLDKIKQQLECLLSQPLPVPMGCQFSPLWQRGDYAQAFAKTQEYIKAGDTYQINLTQAWQAGLTDKLANYLPKLQSTMNAPFAAFLRADDFELLSLSPELFFEFYKKDGQIHITTKPIKGTRPRSADPSVDEQLKNELADSDKDISENVMIVDLLRNDLGKYAHVGTVKTPKRFAIESFQNVHHMVSTITATLKSDTHPLAVLFGSLPAGSITGAPKKRACEIISELENQPRGAYCGTMGYVNFDGTGRWNVLIRTLQAQNSQAQLWAGGGVTIKSNCDDEYQECLDKVGVIMKAMA